ncbi:MAG: AMP-binding protein, partial [Caulobacteraceae bacterium]
MTDVLAPAKPATRAEAIAELTAPGQPYELERLRVGEAEVRWFRNGPTSLRQLFAENRSDKPFFVYGEERWTFEEAWRDAARVARHLVQDYGVKKGDRVAISMRNYPEWVLAFTAAASLGAVAVAMNALWRPEEMEYGLKDCGAKVLFADEERLERLAACSPALKVASVSVRAKSPRPGVRDMRELLAGDADMPAVEIGPDDPATMFYTSGSTGMPKGVVSSNRNVLAALLSWELDGQVALRLSGLEPPVQAVQPAALLAVPLFHVTGSHAVYLQSYRMQRKLVSMFKWDPEEAGRLIEAEKITSFTAPAAMTGDLV